MKILRLFALLFIFTTFSTKQICCSDLASFLTYAAPIPISVGLFMYASIESNKLDSNSEIMPTEKQVSRKFYHCVQAGALFVCICSSYALGKNLQRDAEETSLNHMHKSLDATKTSLGHIHGSLNTIENALGQMQGSLNAISTLLRESQSIMMIILRHRYSGDWGRHAFREMQACLKSTNVPTE